MDFQITSISSGDDDDEICIMPSNSMSDNECLTDNDSQLSYKNGVNCNFPSNSINQFDKNQS